MGADPYVYPGTDVLKNKLGIQDKKLLEANERYFTHYRSIEINDNPIKGKFDFNHLKEIHRHIFQDIYEWAGKSRTVDIAKSHTFCLSKYIDVNAEKIFSGLKKDNYLRGLEAEAFAEKAGYYLGEINALHPFREGNGRAQRAFMCALARKAGYKLDWERVTPEKMIDASVKSFGADYDEMKKVILSVMAPLSAPEKRITVQLEINRIEAIHNVGKRPPFLPGHIKDPDPVREYRNQAKEILKNSRDWPGPDADIEITKKMILQGYSKERISRALKAASPELSGKASNLDAQYIGKTLEKALQAPELQKTLRSFNRGLSR